MTARENDGRPLHQPERNGALPLRPHYVQPWIL